MIKEFSTFGSCASRGIFNSKINRNYKKYFHVNYSVESSSLISLMSKPLINKEELIDTNNSYSNICVTDDITKNFIKFLKKDKIDYLILDTYFDVICSVIKIDKNQFVTNTSNLRRTTLYKELLEYPKISIAKNFDDFYQLYTKKCDKFFKFLNKNCRDLKIILNGSRSVYKYSKNGEIVENANFKKISHMNNYRNILDGYILKNFDVEFLPFNKNTLYDVNYLFGIHHTHYESKYFQEKTEQLNDIIRRNDILQWEDKLNKDFRKNLRENCILNWNNNILKNKISNITRPKVFYKYTTARIDIKNEGGPDNSIKILKNSDPDSNIMYPSWYKNELGIGTQIHSTKGTINLKLKCINNGTLKIILRGIDAKNENNKRIPIYINYTDFNVNKNNIITKEVSVCHDDPIVFKKNVKNSEIIDIFIKWVPI